MIDTGEIQINSVLKLIDYTIRSAENNKFLFISDLKVARLIMEFEDVDTTSK